MKIEPRGHTAGGADPLGEDGSEHRRLARREDLRRLLRSDDAGRPVCAPDCPAARLTYCSRLCPDLPRRMSSDPDYPLENGIAPLAYELKRLGVFQPCWSCEGHYGPGGKDGGLWKKPSVWFYCDSVVHLRVLADAIKALYMAGRLSTSWRVALTFSDPGNPDTTFALEPNLESARGSDTPRLENLQRDATTLAEHLRGTAFEEARKLMAQAD